MVDQNNTELIIEGFGSSDGGIYNTVKINGHGTISSDLNCQSFTCNGIAKIDGNLETNKGTLQGILTVLGDIKGSDLKFSGKADLDGSIFSDEVQIDGDFAANGSFETENFNSRGRVTLGEHLNAQTITFNLFGHSKIKQIKGDEILIKKGHKKINIFNHTFDPLKSKLTTDRIEGETIYLEHTHAIIVRGKDITIGPGCKIDHLEYENTFTQQDDDSMISKTFKT